MSKHYPSSNFLTAAANATGTIKVAPGVYQIVIYGTQTNAATDSTLDLAAAVNEAQTAYVSLAGGNPNDSAFADGAVTLDAGHVYLSYGVLSSVAPVVSPIYLRHGLRWAFVKGSATAIDLTVVCIPVAEL